MSRATRKPRKSYFRSAIEAAAEGGSGADNQVAPVAVRAGEQLMNKALTWHFQMQGKLK